MATIDDLTNATTDLLTAVNVAKTTLDSSVAAAVDAAETTAEDRIQTGQDRAQTGQDRTQTGADRAATQAALADAVAVVYEGEASITPAAGKIPIAGADGHIDPGWTDGQSTTCTTFDNKRLTFTNGLLTLVEEL
jgi:uncharacterized phage infection (PIP) family protein YhgE